MVDVVTDSLPRWDMDVVFPGLDSPAFIAALGAVGDGIDSLAALYDERGVARLAGASSGAALARDVTEVLRATNALYSQYETVEAYIYAFVTTESTNELAQARASELRARAVTLAQLDTRLQAWLGTMDAEAIMGLSDEARAHAQTLRLAAVQARHQMSPAEEDLAAALEPSSGAAWDRLHNDITAGLDVPLIVRGTARHLPMSLVRALAFDPDAAVRRGAYVAELSAWKSVEIPLAAALNGIKGEVGVLNGRRGWADSVAPSLHQNGIDAATLEAMHAAITESFPAFRRYLRAKAALLGRTQLPWWDLFAPVGSAPRRWTFAEARDHIIAELHAFGPRLAGLATRAFAERWIDAEPRTGKIGGAYCMSLRADESRILANFDGTFDGVTTLAHELGHAYHNVCLADRTYLQRVTPMTLAETASIFCELLVETSALAHRQGAERLAALDLSLQGACQVVVDIHSRFLFERHVFERRQERELSPGELCAAIVAAQQATYGDGLDPSALHPYMWAVKGHYYSTGMSYYNYPYAFGQLFGLGLFARYRAEGASFAAVFDDLLSNTGLADAMTLGARVGIDLHAPEFWRTSLAVIGDRIADFEAHARAD